MATATLAFEILARDKASRTLKNVGDEVDKAGRKVTTFGNTSRDDFKRVGGSIHGLGGRFTQFGRVAALGLGAAAVGAVALGKGFIDAAIESEKASKQTTAVIKSMGGASKVTAKQVANLSKQLSMQTGIDDELIQAGQNVLLTFGKVRNEVGKGNKIFDRATKAAVNMSVALGTDLSSANIQVGKALNDPIKGITALTRAGVSFTKQQKEQITALVESGKTLDAQKIILGELEKQFGGSAEAQATAGEKLQVVWGNLQEDLGMRLLPVFETVATWLSDHLPDALDTLGGWLDTAGDKISEFWGALTTGKGETGLERAGVAIHDIWENIVFPVLKRIADWITKTLIPTLGDVLSWFVDNKAALVGVLAAIASGFVAWAVSAAAAALATWAAILPLAPIIALVAAAAAALFLFADRGDGATDTLIRLAGGIKLLGEQAIIKPFQTLLNFITWIRVGVGLLIETIKDLIDLIPTIPIPKLPNLPGAGGGIPFLPFLDNGGVMPGPRGVHSLAWVAGGETVLPTHKTQPNPGSFGGDITLNVTQLPGENQIDAGMRALRHHKRTQLIMAGA